MNTENNVLEMQEEDIIKKLLGEVEVPKAVVVIERIGIPVEFKGLNSIEIAQIRKKCTSKRKVKGVMEEKLNGEEYDAGLILGATTNFNWNDSRLLEKHGVSDGKQFILRKLLGGERTNLVNKVLELSGYDNELSDAEDIKNLSGEEE
ncbi:UNVERIFIED_ORG: hypothetical protein B2H98_06845 [Clostridium botulinum]